MVQGKPAVAPARCADHVVPVARFRSTCGHPGVGPPDDSMRYHSPTLEEATPFEFKHPGWSYWMETRADWEARLRDALDRALEDYLADCQIEIDRMDLVPTETPRQTGDWHVPAFVRFLVLRQTEEQIAAEHGVSEDAVDKAFDDIKRLAGFPIPAGRGRGSRNTRPRRTARR